MHHESVVIVGSGPAGIAVARAVAEAGVVPLVVDGGDTLEPDLAARVAAMRASTPAEALAKTWPFARTRSGIAKPIFGSDFAYRGSSTVLRESARDTHAVFASLAVGGLGTVWGAAVMRKPDAEFDGWPIGGTDLAEDYGAVERLLGCASAPTDGVAPHSAAAHEMIAHATRAPAKGWRVEISRLAVSAACRRCAMCLDGCVYGAIFDPAAALADMVRAGRARHAPGLRVERFEAGAATRLDCRDPTGGTRTISADRVFVAAGALGSARLALASLDPAAELPLLDSAHLMFSFPLRRIRRRGAEGLALAELFATLEDARVSGRTIAAQIYTASPGLEARLAERLALAGPFARWLAARVAPGLAVGQGYLHSDASDRARLCLAGDGRLDLRADAHAIAPATIARLRPRLRELAASLGGWPSSLVVRRSRLGEGNHIGGSLPMRRDPGPLETDALGRPHGRGRLHFVDSSVLPALSATTITATVMANARRIARTAMASDPAP